MAGFLFSTNQQQMLLIVCGNDTEYNIQIWDQPYSKYHRPQASFFFLVYEISVARIIDVYY